MLRDNGITERISWRLVTAALALACAGIAVTLDAWRDILHIALRDEEASHVFTAIPVAAWLFWVRRRRLRHCRIRHTWAGPALIALGWFFYRFGDLGMMQLFWHGGAVMILIGCLVTLLGGDLLLNFLPAFVALFFLLPLPGQMRQLLAAPMGTITASLIQQIFELGGWAMGRSGNLLILNNTQIPIAYACNGLRMVFALGIVAYAFAFGYPLRWYVRAGLLVLSPLSAIACNILRLIPTVWLYACQSDAFAEIFHTGFSWVMLIASFIILMGLLQLLRWMLIPVTWFTLAYD